jgi:hypothetical protein
MWQSAEPCTQSERVGGKKKSDRKVSSDQSEQILSGDLGFLGQRSSILHENFEFGTFRSLSADLRLGLGFLVRAGIPIPPAYSGFKYQGGVFLSPKENFDATDWELFFPVSLTAGKGHNGKEEVWLHLGARARLPVVGPSEDRKLIHARKLDLLGDVGFRRDGSFDVFVQYDFRGLFIEVANA